MSAALAIAADRTSNVLAFSAIPEDAVLTEGLRDDEAIHDPAFARMSAEAKSKYLVKKAAMKALDRTGNKTAVAKMLEKQLATSGRGFSAKRLLNDYYAWIASAQDWRMLVDAALAPEFRKFKKSVGLCAPIAGDGAAVPLDTSDWWIQLAEDNQRSAAPAWREAKRLWRDSWTDHAIRIPGYGSAREYWARENPFLLSSVACPPDLPRGWSQSTFYAKMPLEWESANARVGSAYARALLPGVPATRKGARYLEWVFFDDKWHDLFVIVDGVLTPCRLLELGALDYATGEYIVWGYRPELPAVGDEGRLRLKEQDMKWLVAALLQQEGFPRDYDCHLVCELGTAVLREGPARALFDLTGGRVKTCYTEMQGGMRLVWNEKGKGNSRGKAPLESLHNYLKNESGSLPGQTGVDHERQPATLPLQLRETRDMLALSALMAPEDAQRIQHTLLRYNEATEALDAIYRRANERWDHNLEGVEEDVIGWRVSAGQPWTWSRELPAGTQRIAGFETTTRKPSPLEMKALLKAGQTFLSLPDWVWPLFFDHTQKVGRIEKMEFTFKHEKREFVFWPDEDGLPAAREMEMKREKLCGYYNERNPDRIYLTRENGQFFATWKRVQRASRGDRQALADLREQVSKRAAFARRGPLRRQGDEQARLLRQTFDNGVVLQEARMIATPIPDNTRPGAELSRAVAAAPKPKQRGLSTNPLTAAWETRAPSPMRPLSPAPEQTLSDDEPASPPMEEPEGIDLRLLW